VDVVRLVVENGEFLDLANDLTKVGLAVGSLAGGLLAERVGEEVVAQIVILQRRVANLAEKTRWMLVRKRLPVSRTRRTSS